MQDRDRGALRVVEGVEFVELDRSGCLALVGTKDIGRVIYNESALPAAQPVTFLLDDDEVVFCTNGGGKLAAAIRNAVVGFQLDELDPVTRTGWTVLGVGEAYEITEPRRLASLQARLPLPWVPAHTTYTADTISVPLQRLTGLLLVTVGTTPHRSA